MGFGSVGSTLVFGLKKGEYEFCSDLEVAFCDLLL